MISTTLTCLNSGCTVMVGCLLNPCSSIRFDCSSHRTMSLVIHCVPAVQLPSRSPALLCTASRVPAVGHLTLFLFISERTHSSFRGRSWVDLPLTASRMIIDLHHQPPLLLHGYHILSLWSSCCWRMPQIKMASTSHPHYNNSPSD